MKCPEGSKLYFSELSWDYECRSTSGDKMENELKAAKILLRTMEEAIKPLLSYEVYVQMALDHRDRFDKATLDNLEIRKAGMKVVSELARYRPYY